MIRWAPLSILGACISLSANALATPKLSAELARLPISPGAWSVLFDGSKEPIEGFVRAGPGGAALLIETSDWLDAVTYDTATKKYRLTRYGASGALELAGTLEGPSLSFETAKPASVRITYAREPDGTLHVKDARGPDARWTNTTPVRTPGRATGIGGVFFKATDAPKLRAWYRKNLSLPLEPEPFILLTWREQDDPFSMAHTVWATFKKDTKHFDGPCMVNYRVDRLEPLLAKLRTNGVKIERTEDEPGNGRFAWIRDGEQNLVELWEPPPGR